MNESSQAMEAAAREVAAEHEGVLVEARYFYRFVEGKKIGEVFDGVFPVPRLKLGKIVALAWSAGPATDQDGETLADQAYYEEMVGEDLVDEFPFRPTLPDDASELAVFASAEALAPVPYDLGRAEGLGVLIGFIDRSLVWHSPFEGENWRRLSVDKTSHDLVELEEFVHWCVACGAVVSTMDQGLAHVYEVGGTRKTVKLSGDDFDPKQLSVCPVRLGWKPSVVPKTQH